MPVQLPDTVWLQIWREVAPNPVQMADMRTLCRQQRDVLATDSLWRKFSPQALAEGQPLMQAFIGRTACRSAKGNKALSKIYSGSMEPVLIEYPYKHERAYREGGTGGRTSFEFSISQYLLIGAYGRDDDFDAACVSVGAFYCFWEIYTRVIRNDAAIVGSAAAKDGRVLSFAGVGLLTPGLIRAGLESGQGAAIAGLPRWARHNPEYIRLAISRSELAYEALDQQTQANREYAQLHVALHPRWAAKTFAYFGDVLDFHTSEHLRAIGDDNFRRITPLAMRRNPALLAKLVANQPAALKDFVDLVAMADNAALIREAWLLAGSPERAQIRAHASRRLQELWPMIENVELFCEAPKPPTPLSLWARFKL